MGVMERHARRTAPPPPPKPLAKQFDFIKIPRADWERLDGKPWLDVVSEADFHGWLRFHTTREIAAQSYAADGWALVYHGAHDVPFLCVRGW